MKYLSLSIPGFSNIATNSPSLTPLPQGVPTGGFDTMTKIIGVFITLALIFAIAFAVYAIAHGAFNIITSAGDKKNVQNGRNRIFSAIIGLILVFISFFFINFIGKFIGIDDLLSLFK